MKTETKQFKAEIGRMLDLVVDLGLACNKVLSVVSIDLTRYAEWKDTLPFYRNIQKEGVVLWQAA